MHLGTCDWFNLFMLPTGKKNARQQAATSTICCLCPTGFNGFVNCTDYAQPEMELKLNLLGKFIKRVALSSQTWHTIAYLTPNPCPPPHCIQGNARNAARRFLHLWLHITNGPFWCSRHKIAQEKLMIKAKITNCFRYCVSDKKRDWRLPNKR